VARPPTAGALLVGGIPLATLALSVPLWDRVHPLVAGLPFNLCWLTTWVVLCPVCMTVAYRLDRRRDRADGAPR
jgi:hypothetical protein